MTTVEVFIGTSLRGPARGTGRTMYLMRTKKRNGEDHESIPEVAEYEDTTESRLVLYAVKEAIGRLNFACEVVIHTECDYVAAAVNQKWPEGWQENGWKSSKGKEVKDAELWGSIMQILEESGHELKAEPGKHEWSQWMAWKMPLATALREIFTKIPKE